MEVRETLSDVLRNKRCDWVRQTPQGLIPSRRALDQKVGLQLQSVGRTFVQVSPDGRTRRYVVLTSAGCAEHLRTVVHIRQVLTVFNCPCSLVQLIRVLEEPFRHLALASTLLGEERNTHIARGLRAKGQLQKGSCCRFHTLPC